MSAIRVLVADDDPQLGQMLKPELTGFGYEVECVEDGVEAVSKLQEKIFDVAIVDIWMPRLDGFGVLKFIRDNRHDVKVIMLTAYADLRHSVMSFEGGADEFLTKPYDLEMLRITIERLSSKPTA